MSACNILSFGEVLLIPSFMNICRLVQMFFKEIFAWMDKPSRCRHKPASYELGKCSSKVHVYKVIYFVALYRCSGR